MDPNLPDDSLNHRAGFADGPQSRRWPPAGSCNFEFIPVKNSGRCFVCRNFEAYFEA